MIRFCDVCTSLLTGVTSTSELYYQCTKCQKRFPKQSVDTLRFQQLFGRAKLTDHNLLINAAFDVTNPREYKQCPECPRQIMSYAVIGESMRYVYVCECGHRQ